MNKPMLKVRLAAYQELQVKEQGEWRMVLRNGGKEAMLVEMYPEPFIDKLLRLTGGDVDFDRDDLIVTQADWYILAKTPSVGQQ